MARKTLESPSVRRAVRIVNPLEGAEAFTTLPSAQRYVDSGRAEFVGQRKTAMRFHDSDSRNIAALKANRRRGLPEPSIWVGPVPDKKPRPLSIVQGGLCCPK
jgi:hypothetical protein